MPAKGLTLQVAFRPTSFPFKTSRLSWEGNAISSSYHHSTSPINSLGRSAQAVDYRFVVIELDDMEAEAVNWRAGFYKTAFSLVEIVTKLGKPNATSAEH